VSGASRNPVAPTERFEGPAKAGVLVPGSLDERGEIGQSHAVVVLLIDIHDTRLALPAAFAVVEHDHLMSRRRRIGDAHADGRVSPLLFQNFDPVLPHSE
jgi:hypothetical protein